MTEQKVDAFNEITDSDAGGGGSIPCSIEIEGDSETIYLQEFVTDVVSPASQPLRKRIRFSTANVAPRDFERDLFLWTFRAIIFIWVGTITLLGLPIFMCFLIAATLNAIIVSLLVLLAIAGGFLAIFFACLATAYIGALSFAVFIISTITISGIISVFVVTGWIGFFWIVWLAVKKSLDLTKQSISMTSSAVLASLTAWQARQGVRLKIKHKNH